MTTTTSKLGADMTRKPLIESPDILQRIKGAKERLRDGYALMRIPVDPTDPDCVLADAELEIERLRALLARQPAAIGKQEAVAWAPDSLYEAIEKVLLSHKLSNWQDQYENQLGLVDRLCDDDATDIASGQHAIRLICDEIYNEVLTAAAPLDTGASKPAAPSVAQDERGANGSWVNEPPRMPWEGEAHPAPSEDERAAVDFYANNPSAALFDFLNSPRRAASPDTPSVEQDERVAFKEFRAALCRFGDANTPMSIADRVMILSNATFLLDEYVRASSAVSAAPSVEQDDPTDYEAIEREHLGDAEKRTGIYAPKVEQDESGAKATNPQGNDALFARVTDWVNEHRIPFDAQNELFRILAASTTWEALFDRVALELNCLPSSFVDGNEHVFSAIEKLCAASTSANVAQGAEAVAWRDVIKSYPAPDMTLAPPVQPALADDARKRVAKAIVETYLGFPAPDREPCELDLKAADAAYAALTAAQSASGDTQ